MRTTTKAFAGGIYALERIARDSRRDHAPAMQILGAYVREQAPWTRDDRRAHDAAEIKAPNPPPLRLDIQAAVNVIARRRCSFEDKGFIVDLRDCDLRGLDAAHLDLGQVSFSGSNLEYAVLKGASLDDTEFESTTLHSLDVDLTTHVPTNRASCYSDRSDHDSSAVRLGAPLVRQDARAQSPRLEHDPVAAGA